MISHPRIMLESREYPSEAPYTPPLMIRDMIFHINSIDSITGAMNLIDKKNHHLGILKLFVLRLT